MGEIADDMINGLCCSLCNVYFEEEHGHPVVCDSCYEVNCGYPIATNKEIGEC